jgi:hypothetical protein
MYVESGSGCGLEGYGRLEGLCEYVKCPVKGEDVPFPRCFVCASFIRRVKGFVHCSGERFEIRA